MTAAEADRSWAKSSLSPSRPRPRGRLRTRLVGLAALFGVLLGAFALPQAAHAADFEHWISTGHDQWVDVGGAPAYVTHEVKATFDGDKGPQDVVITAELSGLDELASIDVQEGACTRTNVAQATCSGMTPNEQRQIQFVIAPVGESDLPEGETKTGELKINAGGRGNGEQKTSVTVAGHAQAGPSSVTEVAGQVTSNAEPIDGAKVVLTDGEGTDHETSTDGSGQFRFEGSDDGTFIAPGTLKLTVSKEGFEDRETEFDVAEGTGFSQNMTIDPVEEEAEETTEAATSEAASEEPTPSVAAAEGGGMSGTLLFLLIVGGLLVVGGIVGIIFLLRGGKDDDEVGAEDRFPEGPPDHQPTAAQVGSPGVYQSGPAPGAEAPTMVHNGPLVQDGQAGAPGAPGAPGSAFGPAYGSGDDSTQVMPQAGGPGGPPPEDDTRILSTVQGPGGPGRPGAPGGPPNVPGAPQGPGGDSTQVMPQAGGPGGPPPARPPQSSFGDPAATQPHPSPTPPPTGSSMFEPPRPSPSPQPPAGHDPYAPPPQPSPSPQPSPQQSPYPPQGGRDPYAPPPATDEPYAPGQAQGMPQGGYGSQPPASPYGADRPQRPEDEDPPTPSRYRRDDERRGWGEWDDRPRSW
ncbi:carboxypeptidase-like regulatory domain-containing protein [Glycomyces xiaoerkulensis]|uniref:carboxypeptidase-like regulatory domain-containing protein n=1 Tax=Glycomyces xiaoerkulensis TaxID=2038139 RepID=UPI000C26A10F|nr:carboxypeptidase-like regulatory domain-containing protein [Glycomyces xiaoerkulensis]